MGSLGLQDGSCIALISCPFFSPQKDPSTVLAASPGKLVRFIVPDGGAVVAGQPMMEIEVMKMLMNYQAPASGVVHYQVGEEQRLGRRARLALARVVICAAAPRTSALLTNRWFCPRSGRGAAGGGGPGGPR